MAVDKTVPWWGVTLFNRRFGFEHSLIQVGGVKYLERWILYLGGCNLRLHKFFRGDDDRAPHDHPFNFWTFPLTSYWEKVPVGKRAGSVGSAGFEHALRNNFVQRWRIHYRPATYQHIVECPIGSHAGPWWTIVFATYQQGRKWGFYPIIDGKPTFVYWRDFK